MACDVSADIRDAVTAYAKKRNLVSAFWARSELDNKVEAHPKIRDRFFNLPAVPQHVVPLRDRVIHLDRQHIGYVSSRSINIARIIIAINLIFILSISLLSRAFYGSWLPPVSVVLNYYCFMPLIILPTMAVWLVYGALPFKQGDGDCYVSNDVDSRRVSFGARFGTRREDGNYEIWAKANDCIFDGCHGTVYATYVNEEKVDQEGNAISHNVLRGICNVDPGHHQYALDKLDRARPLLPN